MCFQSMRRVIHGFLSLALMSLAASAADAQQTPPRPARYLIVVETSSATVRAAGPIENALSRLLLSGLNGQLRAGDTIGLWTFNDSLHSGDFPLQTWTPEMQQPIATNVMGFVRGLRYEKPGRIETVLPHLQALAKESEKLTVLIFSSGEQNLAGVPFSAQINAAYEAGRPAVRKERVPFVTVLRMQRGRALGWSVSWPPWPVEFAAFHPDPPLPAPRPPVATRPQTNAAPVKQAEPLIVVGNKRVTELPAQPPTRPPEKTNPAVAASSVQSAPLPHVAAAETKTADTVVASVDQPTGVPPATVPTTPAKQEISGAPAPAVPAPANPVAVSEKTPAAIPQTPTGLPSEPATSETSQTAVQTAVVTPADSSRTIYFVAGFVALIAAAGLAFLMFRRAQSPTQASLITRSMDDGKGNSRRNK